MKLTSELIKLRKRANLILKPVTVITSRALFEVTTLLSSHKVAASPNSPLKSCLNFLMTSTKTTAPQIWISAVLPMSPPSTNLPTTSLVTRATPLLPLTAQRLKQGQGLSQLQNHCIKNIPKRTLVLTLKKCLFRMTKATFQ